MNGYIAWLIKFSLSTNKTIFFQDSPTKFLFTPVGFGYVLVIFLSSFLFGFIYQTTLKQVAIFRTKRSTTFWKNRARLHNIGSGDRWLRAIIGAGLLTYAVTTTWSPTILFFSGFCFFEAIFSWCGFYAAIGRNSCPV